jgi:hypothetical protein
MKYASFEVVFKSLDGFSVKIDNTIYYADNRLNGLMLESPTGNLFFPTKNNRRIQIMEDNPTNEVILVDRDSELYRVAKLAFVNVVEEAS